MEPKKEWLTNPEVFGVNRQEAHSDHKFYEGSGKKPSNVSVMFTLNIEDIVAIY